jgi:hypothetical protein
MTNKVKNEKMSEKQTQIAGLIQEYYWSAEEHSGGSKRQLHSSLWEIVCDDLDIDYEDETYGEIFDTIMQEYK